MPLLIIEYNYDAAGIKKKSMEHKITKDVI